MLAPPLDTNCKEKVLVLAQKLEDLSFTNKAISLPLDGLRPCYVCSLW